MVQTTLYPTDDTQKSPYWTFLGPLENVPNSVRMHGENTTMRSDKSSSECGFEPLLDNQEVAHLMGLHPETVKRRARTGERSQESSWENFGVFALPYWTLTSRRRCCNGIDAGPKDVFLPF